MIFKTCIYFPFSLYHDASLAQMSCLTSSLVHLSRTPKTKANTLFEGRIFHTMYRILWKGSFQAGNESGKPLSLVPEAGPEQISHGGAAQSLALHPSRGPDRQMLHINSLCSGYLWVHPSRNLPHILAAQVNSRGKKKHV